MVEEVTDQLERYRPGGYRRAPGALLTKSRMRRRLGSGVLGFGLAHVRPRPVGSDEGEDVASPFEPCGAPVWAPHARFEGP